MSNQAFRLLGYQGISGIIRCKTGLRIGGSSETIEIGGLDNPVIKHPITEEPYIPGSSLKGKMRSLLELKYGFIDPSSGEAHKYKGTGCEQEKCPVCRIFGVSAGDGAPFGPSRLIVCDAKLEKLSGADAELKQTEIKWENSINRINGKADPRQMERVPAGAEFSFEMHYRVFDVDGDGGETDKNLFGYVLQGLKLLEMDTLGSSGSRGYGKVEFGTLKEDKFAAGKVLVTFVDGRQEEKDIREVPLEKIKIN